MVRCGCASDQCSCTIVAGENVSVSGTGSRSNPYVVSAATQVIDESGNPTGGGADRLPGEMTMWGGLAAPEGWLLCNGAAINRAVYADLFAVIGTRFGAGNGSTTFNLPNLAGRFPLGASGTDPLGASGGTNSKTLTEANLPPHTHSIDHDHPAFDTPSSGGHQHSWARYNSNNDGVRNDTRRDGSGNNSSLSSDGNHTHNIDIPAYEGDSGSSGSGTPIDIKPAFVSVNFIIKA